MVHGRTGSRKRTDTGNGEWVRRDGRGRDRLYGPNTTRRLGSGGKGFRGRGGNTAVEE